MIAPPPIGSIVHVAGTAGRCRPALVLDAGPRLVRLRVFIASAIGSGTHDDEGDYAHASTPVVVPNPADYGGGFRVLDAWHYGDGLAGPRAGEGGGCEISALRLRRAIENVTVAAVLGS